jgi:hypothetical protein
MSDPGQDLLLLVAANEVVLAQQAAALLKITDQDAADRLDQLRVERLVSRAELSSRLPPAYRITRNGADRIDCALPPLRPLDTRRYRHEIAIAWLWVTARRGNLGELRDVLSRREMQAADATLRSESLLDTPGATFRDQPAAEAELDARHAYPDLALVQANGGWATLDVVLTLPTPARLRATLGRIQRDPLMLAQLFMVEQDEPIKETIRATADALGVANKVRVTVLARDGIAGA